MPPFLSSAFSGVPIELLDHSRKQEGGLCDGSPPPSWNASILNKTTFLSTNPRLSVIDSQAAGSRAPVG